MQIFKPVSWQRTRGYLSGNLVTRSILIPLITMNNHTTIYVLISLLLSMDKHLSTRSSFPVIITCILVVNLVPSCNLSSLIKIETKVSWWRKPGADLKLEIPAKEYTWAKISIKWSIFDTWGIFNFQYHETLSKLNWCFNDEWNSHCNIMWTFEL